MPKENQPINNLNCSEVQHITEQVDVTTPECFPSPPRNESSFDRHAAGQSRFLESSDETAVTGSAQTPSPAKLDKPNTSKSSLKTQYLFGVSSDNASDDPSATAENVMRHQNQIAGGIELHQLRCVYCNEGFVEVVSLKDHIISLHNGEKPYTCRICGKGFKTMEIRNKHLSIHDKKKELFICHCGRCFPTKCSLNFHAKSHTTEFMCRVCNSRFCSRGHLERHVKVKNHLNITNANESMPHSEI